MALTNRSASSSASSQNAKTIAAKSGTAGTLLYTVPEGREAEIWINTTTSSSYGKINDVNIGSAYTSAAFAPFGPFKLAAGGTYKVGTAGTQGIYGIEYDAQL